MKQLVKLRNKEKSFLYEFLFVRQIIKTLKVVNLNKNDLKRY